MTILYKLICGSLVLLEYIGYGGICGLTGTNSNISKHPGKYFNSNGTSSNANLITDVVEQSTVAANTFETNTPFQNENFNNVLGGGEDSSYKEPVDNPNEKILNIVRNENNTDFDSLLLKMDRDYANSCLLDGIKSALLWWTFPNGTLKDVHLNFAPLINFLDLSYRHISSDEALYDKTRIFEVNEIVVFSAAYNNLPSVPQRTLDSIAGSLKYLTLCGNIFNAYSPEMQNDGKAETTWATFPYLPNLIELDISNCQIEHITRDAFRNLSNLKNLYMSHNKITVLLSDTFYYVQSSLQYLDLTFTNVFDYNYQVSMPTLEAIINLFYGLKVQQTTFKYLPNLIYLDLSHTKLTRNSAMAFTHLGEKLKYLSLCYTAFPMIGNAIFKNTALVGLDLSGNAYAAYNILDDAFEGLTNLIVLYFELSNLKDISWVKCLSNLRILGVAGNNINSVTFDTFSALSSLQVLDLSANYVGNWYNRVFTNNQNLRILNIRDNNINIITSEMLKDFSLLDYLSLGDNNFVCDCMLRDLVDIAESNNQNPDCAHNMIVDVLEYISDNSNKLTDRASRFKISDMSRRLDAINTSSIIGSHIFKRLRRRMGDSKKRIKQMRFVLRPNNSTRSPKACPSAESQANTATISKLNGSLLKFQLLDYEDERYWCFNETEKLSFVQLNCHQRSLAETIVHQLNNLTFYVIVCVGTLLGVSLIGLIVYIKRWHIYYYYSSLRSAALMSEATKENVDKFNTLSEHGSNMMYDIFISYCQNDRDWVLHELIPNVENGDVAICLHERDFQIGVTILDNIISCMDRSRSLMLIISSNFLLSHWCQFEMHLAQRRMFDVCKDRLILVLLEDIPKSKRPKILQYLMDVKTYIKWPGGKSKGKLRPEDYNLFWKRLKRSLQSIGN